MKQNITILGSTGSIGTNTLDVLSNHLDRFQVFALTASKQVDLILAQCAKFKPQYAVMAQEFFHLPTYAAYIILIGGGSSIISFIFFMPEKIKNYISRWL